MPLMLFRQYTAPPERITHPIPRSPTHCSTSICSLKIVDRVIRIRNTSSILLHRPLDTHEKPLS
jgi:hypothetical protein